MIELSEGALAFLHAQFLQHPDQDCWKLSLRKTGCSGYRYQASWQVLTSTQAVQVRHGWWVMLDPVWQSSLSGIVVDVSVDVLGQRRLIFKHPRLHSACGCGESFMLDQS